MRVADVAITRYVDFGPPIAASAFNEESSCVSTVKLHPGGTFSKVPENAGVRCPIPGLSPVYQGICDHRTDKPEERH